MNKSLKIFIAIHVLVVANIYSNNHKAVLPKDSITVYCDTLSAALYHADKVTINRLLTNCDQVKSSYRYVHPTECVSNIYHSFLFHIIRDVYNTNYTPLSNSQVEYYIDLYSWDCIAHALYIGDINQVKVLIKNLEKHNRVSQVINSCQYKGSYLLDIAHRHCKNALKLLH